MITKWDRVRRRINSVVLVVFSVAASCTASAAPPGFIKSTVLLGAPPVGLAFDADGILYALESAPFATNQATLRIILPDGSHGDSFTISGDDSNNFFVGSMAYDPLGDQLLITDNTSDGRLYAVSKTGVKQEEPLATGISGAAGVAVRDTGEIFVSTSPFGSSGEVLLVDRTSRSATCVLGDHDTCAVAESLGFGAGLAFDSSGDLIIQDANTSTFRGRLQRLPVVNAPGGLEFGTPVSLIDDMQSSAGLMIDSEGDIFTTGSGGLFRVDGSPLMELPFDDNGKAFQFATAIAFDPGSHAFEGFAGPSGGRLAYMADFGFASQDSFVTLLTPAQPGDYNTDGQVDGEDYASWQSTFGSTDLSADGNRDGRVDAADYVIWRKNSVAAATTSSATLPLSVPEPMTVGLAVFGLAALLINCPRRRR